MKNTLFCFLAVLLLCSTAFGAFPYKTNSVVIDSKDSDSFANYKCFSWDLSAWDDNYLYFNFDVPVSNAAFRMIGSRDRRVYLDVATTNLISTAHSLTITTNTESFSVTRPTVNYTNSSGAQSITTRFVNVTLDFYSNELSAVEASNVVYVTGVSNTVVNWATNQTTTYTATSRVTTVPTWGVYTQNWYAITNGLVIVSNRVRSAGVSGINLASSAFTVQSNATVQTLTNVVPAAPYWDENNQWITPTTQQVVQLGLVWTWNPLQGYHWYTPATTIVYTAYTTYNTPITSQSVLSAGYTNCVYTNGAFRQIVNTNPAVIKITTPSENTPYALTFNLSATSSVVPIVYWGNTSATITYGTNVDNSAGGGNIGSGEIKTIRYNFISPTNVVYLEFVTTSGSFSSNWYSSVSNIALWRDIGVKNATVYSALPDVSSGKLYKVSYSATHSYYNKATTSIVSFAGTTITNYGSGGRSNNIIAQTADGLTITFGDPYSFYNTTQSVQLASIFVGETSTNGSTNVAILAANVSSASNIVVNRYPAYDRTNTLWSIDTNEVWRTTAFISRSNLPPVQPYLAEVLAYETTATNEPTRTVAKGTINVLYSLYQETNWIGWTNPIAGSLIGPPIHTLTDPYGWPFVVGNATNDPSQWAQWPAVFDLNMNENDITNCGGFVGRFLQATGAVSAGSGAFSNNVAAGSFSGPTITALQAADIANSTNLTNEVNARIAGDALKIDDTYTHASSFIFVTNGNGITITEYIGTNTEIRIPPYINKIPVRTLAAASFAYNPILFTKCEIPSTVTNIGEGAFNEALGLTSIEIPESITTIPFQLLMGCASLSEVKFSSRLIATEEAAFESTHLTSVSFPETFQSLGNDTFYNDIFLTNITFHGNAPIYGVQVFTMDTGTVYYLAGRSGFGTNYAGLPTRALYGNLNDFTNAGLSTLRLTNSPSTAGDAPWEILVSADSNLYLATHSAAEGGSASNATTLTTNGTQLIGNYALSNSPSFAWNVTDGQIMPTINEADAAGIAWAQTNRDAIAAMNAPSTGTIAVAQATASAAQTQAAAPNAAAMTNTLPAGVLGTNVSRTIGGLSTTGNVGAASFLDGTNVLDVSSGQLNGQNIISGGGGWTVSNLVVSDTRTVVGYGATNNGWAQCVVIGNGAAATYQQSVVVGDLGTVFYGAGVGRYIYVHGGAGIGRNAYVADYGFAGGDSARSEAAEAIAIGNGTVNAVAYSGYFGSWFKFGQCTNTSHGLASYAALKNESGAWVYEWRGSNGVMNCITNEIP